MKLEGKLRIYQMEVSVLLNKLDSLNEEGRAIQKEKQRVDDELANTQLQCELTTQVVLLSNHKVLGNLIIEEACWRDFIGRRGRSDIPWSWVRVDVGVIRMKNRKKREVTQHLHQRIEELKQQKKQIMESLEEEA